MSIIEPIDTEQQTLVLNSTHHYIALASEIFGRPFENIPVNFSLTGRAAGMYHVYRQERYIRYNPFIFSKYFADNLRQTVPHEVAHYVADMLYGIKNIRAHGKEWKKIMRTFGVEAKTYCDYDLQGTPHRQQRRFMYACRCRDYQLTTRRHNMILRGQRSYQCPTCHGRITQKDD